MMDTIIFPETDKRWVNLIPLPPRKGRDGDSVKKSKEKENRK